MDSQDKENTNTLKRKYEELEDDQVCLVVRFVCNVHRLFQFQDLRWLEALIGNGLCKYLDEDDLKGGLGLGMGICLEVAESF